MSDNGPRKRGWLLPALAFCAVVAVLAAGLAVLKARAQPAAAAGATAAPTQPGTAQAQADLTRMQALLNSGSASKQAALLPPPARFAPGSGPVFPAGTKITIRPGTLRSSGQSGTVQAVLSDKTAVTLGLYSVEGHWYLYDVQAGAQTSAKVTAGPAAVNARLMSNTVPSDALPPNQVPTWQEIGQKTPVIFVHGFGESAANWSDGGNMLANVDSINGVMSLRFDYKSTNTKWVDNPLNGPALARYIKAVSAASAQGHGPGKVIIVAFSMGGLLTRYAATTDVPGTGPVAAYISMVITIGTPNEGSLAGNIRPLICAGPTVVTVLAEQHVPGICSDWTAADAMSLFAPQIMKLPQLPPSIPVLHAIAGDETFIWEIWAGHPQSRVMLPFFGDGVVTPGSALHKRPGWQNDTFDTFTNPWIPGDLSAWHLALKGYKPVIAKTRYYIQLYVQANQPQAPAQAAPAPGNDAYWLANGGQWSVHGVQLQISQGPSGLVGTENWNADGAVITGHAQLTFASQPDGSLVGTYTADTTYTGDASQLSVPFQPDPGAPLKGMVVVLRPDGPMHAQVVLGNDSPAMFSGGNLNFCQAGLPDASQYCGA